MDHKMLSKKYSKLSFMKRELVNQIEEIVKDKKEKLNVPTLNFESKDVPFIGGILRIGYYLSKRDNNGLTVFLEWSEVDAMYLIRIKDKLKSNKFYGERYVMGQNCRVRLKSDE